MSDEHDLRCFERLAEELQKRLRNCKTERTRDAIQIDVPDEIGVQDLGSDINLGVLLLLTPDHIEIRLPTVDWNTHGSYSGVASSRLWKRLKIEGYISGDISNEEPILDLIHQGIVKRRSEFRRCRKCGEIDEVVAMKRGRCAICANGGVAPIY